MRVLVLNAGSSTLKWALLEGDNRQVVASGNDTWGQTSVDARSAQVRSLLERLAGFDAVGHRVVHGGVRFVAPVVVDGSVRAALEGLVRLDPLHMQPALAGIDAVSTAAPSVPQVAVFDTAFHAGMPEAASGYGLPFEWSERWGLKRFGFHGLSVQYSLSRAEALLGHTPQRLIVCHLGSGCSITAVSGGRSIDSSMGFTPLEGVMMATRSGSVDPGLLLHLQRHLGLGVEELASTLETRSGLLGVSGVSGDLRRVMAAAESGSPRARLAYERFVWMLRRAVGAMAAVLGGLDAIAFTGGIGENSVPVRADVATALAFAGLRLSDVPPDGGDAIISAAESSVAALLVHAREDLVIFDEVFRFVPLCAPVMARP